MKLRLFLIFCFGLSVTVAGAQTGFIELADLNKIVSLSSPQISPKGDQAIFIVSRKNLEKNQNDAELQWIDLRSNETRVLVRDRRGIGQPRWSPDGTRISFLAGGQDGRQVYILSMMGGDAYKLTQSPAGIKSYEWDPSGKRIGYIAELQKKSESPVISFEVGSQDFLKTSGSTSSNLWIVGLDGGEGKKLLADSITVATDLSVSEIAWSPDGKSILFTAFASPNSGDSDLSKIFKVDVEGLSVTALTKNTSQESSPSFSADGKTIAFLYPRDGVPANQSEVHWIKSQSEIQNISRPIDREINDLQWLENGSAVVAGNDGLTSGLWRITSQQEISKIYLGDLASVNTAHVHPSGAMVLIGSESSRPPELYFKNSLEAKPERRTDFNAEVAAKKMGKTEGFEWKSTKNLQPNGVLTFPSDFDPSKKYPLVLYVHGGPTASSLRSFAAVPQIMAAKGWIVFQPNYRGSNSLGNEFQSAIANDAAEGPGQDVMSGVTELLKRPYVDSKRVAISGWSYGGWMTAWMIGRYPNIWKAAVAGAAPVDYTDMYSLNDLNRMRRHAITDSPYKSDNLKAVYSQSPISYFSKIKTPTLIMSDTGDSRVTITGSYKLYGALRDNKIPVQFIAYPVAGHFPSDPVRSFDVYRRWMDWLDKYLGMASFTAEKR